MAVTADALTFNHVIKRQILDDFVAKMQYIFVALFLLREGYHGRPNKVK